MRPIIFILLLWLGAGCSAVQRRPVAWGHLRGANVEGECAAFARSAYRELHWRGVESYFVEYEWAEQGYHGAHAVVIFRDGLGNLVWADNLSKGPHRLTRAGSVLELVQQITACATVVRGNPKIKL